MDVLRGARSFCRNHSCLLRLCKAMCPHKPLMLIALLAGIVGSTGVSAQSNPPLDLGPLGGNSEAYAVNDSGQVVGDSVKPPNRSLHAFSWTQAGGMIDLGTLDRTDPTAETTAFFVNASGQVVGNSDSSVGIHAFSWTQTGGMVDLGTLVPPQDTLVSRPQSIPNGLNDGGQVVGYTAIAANNIYSTHAFSWTQTGGMVDLGTLGHPPPGVVSGLVSYAEAVNAAGQVVGGSSTASGAASHAFLWKAGGGMIDLGTLGGNDSVALALNDSGQVVGLSTLGVGSNVEHAFLWTRAKGMTDLGTLGGASLQPLAVNASGQVIGTWITAAGVERSFSWTQAGGMVDLGTLGGTASANAVNDSGQVVGWSTLAVGSNVRHAFSWTQAGGMVDLGTLGGTSGFAYAINLSGQIVGGSDTAGDAEFHATLWSPAPFAFDPLCVGGDCSGKAFLARRDTGCAHDQVVPVDDADLLTKADVARTGVAADGVSLLLLRIPATDAPVSFSLQSLAGRPPKGAELGTLLDRNGCPGPGPAKVTITPDVTSQGTVAFALYRAPASVPLGTIGVKFLVGGSTDDSSPRTLGLSNPPVILIHGVWSSPNAWKTLVPFLAAKGYDICPECLVDYSFDPAGNFDPFASDSVGLLSAVDHATDAARNHFRARGVAAAQVDVFGHSMGGLLARSRVRAVQPRPFAQLSNYGSDDFHKLITIGTPHGGSPLADWLTTHLCERMSLGFSPGLRIASFFNLLKRPIGPALFGFESASPARRHLGETLVPSHAVVGVEPGAFGSRLADSATEILLNQIPDLSNHPKDTMDSLMGGQFRHDTIVPIPSQAGGLSGGRTSTISGVVHADIAKNVDETEDERVFAEVARLLAASVTGGSFHTLPPPSISAGGYRAPYTCPFLLGPSERHGAALAAVAMIAPSAGQVVHPGDSVAVTLSLNGGNPVSGAIVIFGQSARVVAGPGPFSATFTVPNIGGQIPIQADTYGPGPDNYEATTYVVVQPASPPLSLSVAPAAVAATLSGEPFQLRVSGRFATGDAIDLTPGSSGTVYSLASGTSAVVSVTSDGLVVAQGNGQDSILVTNGSQAASIPVVATISNHAPVVTPIPNLTLAAGQPLDVPLAASDSDGNAIHWSGEILPPFVTLSDNGNGTGSLRFRPAAKDVGSLDVVAVAADDGTPSLATLLSFSVTVVPAIHFGAANYTVKETTGKVTIDVLRDGVLAESTVGYTTSNGTATDGINYSRSSGSLSFSVGVGRLSFTVPILHDGLAVGDKTFLVRLLGPTGALTISPDTAVVTIVDQDEGGRVQFSAPSYTVNEANSTAILKVTRTGGLASGVAAQFDTSGGTAIPGTDYTPVVGQPVSFAAGETSQPVSVPILNDGTTEGHKTIGLALSNPSGGAVLGAPSTAVLTINEDNPVVQFSASNFSAPESAGSATIAVTRSGGRTADTVTVQYAASDGTAKAPIDYAPTSGVLTFTAGMTSKSFSVTLVKDQAHEPNRTVLLSLSLAQDITSPGQAALGQQSSAVLTINDTDQTPKLQFGASTYSVSETAKTVNVVVRRVGGTGSHATVDYVVTGGTAVAGTNYDLSPGTLTFQPGVLSRAIPVSIHTSSSPVGDLAVNLKLSNPVATDNPQATAVLGSPSATVLTILSDDPLLQFGAGSYKVSDGGPKASIAVRRSGPTSGSVRVDYGDAGGGSASSPQDYSIVPGTLTFGPGVTTQTFDVTVTDGGQVQDDKTVNLMLTNPQDGAAIGPLGSAVLTLATDDPTVRFTSPSYTVAGTAPKAAITLTRTGSTLEAFTVPVLVTDGTGLVGVNYDQPNPSSVAFAKGGVSGRLLIPVHDDLADAPAPITVNLALGTPSPDVALLGSPNSAVLTISDSNAAGAIEFNVSDYSVSETGGTAVVTVTRVGGSASGVTVDYAASTSGSAVSGTNYTLTPGTLAFEYGVTSQTILVTILDDGTHTGNLAVDLHLTNPGGGAALGTRTTATLWIVDAQ